jgi:hypothetical protein
MSRLQRAIEFVQLLYPPYPAEITIDFSDIQATGDPRTTTLLMAFTIYLPSGGAIVPPNVQICSVRADYPTEFLALPERSRSAIRATEKTGLSSQNI